MMALIVLAIEKVQLEIRHYYSSYEGLKMFSIWELDLTETL